jgi:ribonuclease HI
MYADGSSWDGFGGVGCVLLWKDRILEVKVPFNGPGCTNQKMEIFAVIVGLMRIKADRPRRVIVRSDSAYVVNCFRQGWIENWRRKNWHKSGGGLVANREYWETLELWVALHDVEFEHVRGHAGDYYNERADELAGWARDVARRGEFDEFDLRTYWPRPKHRVRRPRVVRARQSR